MTEVGLALNFFLRDSKHLEESLKSRIVVWTLIGIVVIVGVVVIATAPKKASRGTQVTLDSVKSGAAEADTQLDRLAARIATGKKGVAPAAGSNSHLEEADSLLMQARDKLDQASKATDLKQAEQLLMDGRLMLRRARRAVELATSRSRPRGL